MTGQLVPLLHISARNEFDRVSKRQYPLGVVVVDGGCRERVPLDIHMSDCMIVFVVGHLFLTFSLQVDLGSKVLRS